MIRGAVPMQVIIRKNKLMKPSPRAQITDKKYYFALKIISTYQFYLI
jgi:hypothetical protein